MEFPAWGQEWSRVIVTAAKSTKWELQTATTSHQKCITCSSPWFSHFRSVCNFRTFIGAVSVFGTVTCRGVKSQLFISGSGGLLGKCLFHKGKLWWFCRFHVLSSTHFRRLYEYYMWFFCFDRFPATFPCEFRSILELLVRYMKKTETRVTRGYKGVEMRWIYRYIGLYRSTFTRLASGFGPGGSWSLSSMNLGFGRCLG